MYVAVKGGERAIEAAHDWLAEARRGDPEVAEVGVDQIEQQLRLACDRVMGEGSCYDRELAALAVKQARGDLVEAAFLLRAYRTTLPRFGYSEPVITAEMLVARRVSATYKDLPGGQVLGPTFDYTHRLLDFVLLAEGEPVPEARTAPADHDGTMPPVADILDREGLIQPETAVDGPVGDVTREPLLLPADRDVRLQSLARGDEGFLLGMAYATQRGFGPIHPFVGEIRMGEVSVAFVPEELGFAIDLGEIDVTECQMVNQFKGSENAPPQFTRGYGLVFGHAERRAMAMALVDRSLRASELGEAVDAPSRDQEFVLMHADNVQATGFVEHLKLPHYVDFQGELGMIRRLRADWAAAAAAEREAAE
ncbi:MAG: carbon-phosphorus lyase complex subunit PhnI [Pseudomonadota bacterium]